MILTVSVTGPVRSKEHVARLRRRSREALARSAELSGAPTDGWYQDDQGVPLPRDGFYWSISHKHARVAAVVARKPVGIDIELAEPRPRELHDSLASKEEWALLGDRSWPAFFRLWTAKEAALKANGHGIGKLLDCRLVETAGSGHLSFEYAGQPWHVEHHRFENYIAAVTLSGEGIEWVVGE